MPFAMRKNIDTLIVLSKPGEQAMQIKSIDELRPEEAREFLGAIPGILKAGKALVTEGQKEGSVDKDFYQWLLGDPAAEIVPLGSCNNVLKAVKHTDVWKQIAPLASVHGVIDRDFRSDGEIAELQSTCVVTEYHEVESYLCEPGLVSDLSRKVGRAGKQHLSAGGCADHVTGLAAPLSSNAVAACSANAFFKRRRQALAMQ